MGDPPRLCLRACHGWTKGLSGVFSNTTVQKHRFFVAQPSLWSNAHICAPVFLPGESHGWRSLAGYSP